MSSYKLYLHFEGSQAFPDFTYIYKSSRNTHLTVCQLIEEFCLQYSKKHSIKLSTENLQLVSESGNRPDVNSQVVKAFASGSDVQAHTASLADQPQRSDAQGKQDGGKRLEQLAADLQLSSADQRATQHAKDDKRKGASSTDASTRSACTSDLLDQSDGQVYLPIIKQFLERAKEAESKKYYRAACKIYEQVIHAIVTVKPACFNHITSKLEHWWKCRC